MGEVSGFGKELQIHVLQKNSIIFCRESSFCILYLKSKKGKFSSDCRKIIENF
jgi:hypothetical protein